MAQQCGAKNAAGKPCRMKPLRGKRRCLAHSRKAKPKATAARSKGGRRRGEQQRRAAVARAEQLAAFQQLDTVADVEDASAKVFQQLLAGQLGAKEAAAAAKLLNILREGAERRDRERLRSDAPKTKRGRVDGATAIEETVTTFREVVAEARADRGMSPEARRDQIIRAGAVLIKAAEPARVIGELTDELREVNAMLDGKQGGSNGVQKPPAGAAGVEGASR